MLPKINWLVAEVAVLAGPVKNHTPRDAQLMCSPINVFNFVAAKGCRLVVDRLALSFDSSYSKKAQGGCVRGGRPASANSGSAQSTRCRPVRDRTLSVLRSVHYPIHVHYPVRDRVQLAHT
ncbi:unnamed protein product, partial [Brenthis ino]